MGTGTRVLLAFSAALAAAVLAPERGLPADEQATIAFFRTPSGNIGCALLEPTYLRCDIRSGLKPMPPPDKSCQFDWGGGYKLNATGRASVSCISDTVMDARARVVPYGTVWHGGRFTCSSQLAGLRCTNASGHGFFLSKDPSYTF